MTASPRLPRRRLLGALGAALLPAWSAAQAFPAQAVRFIVSFPPGSGADTTARHFAARMGELARQPFVVENRPGANSFIAAQAVARAPADGHTLFFASNSPVAVNPALFHTLPYDPLRDFVPVGRASRATNLVCVGAASPHRSLGELAAAARARPGTLTHASGSAAYQIATGLLAHELGVQVVHVPYKGAAPALTDVVAGVVDFTVSDLTAALPLVQAGKLRALAVTAERRHRALPQVPTAEEAGVIGYRFYNWTGLFAPSGTPAPVIDRLSRWMRAVAAEPATADFLERAGAEPFWAAPPAFRAYQESQIAFWRAAAQRAGIHKE